MGRYFFHATTKRKRDAEYAGDAEDEGNVTDSSEDVAMSDDELSRVKNPTSAIPPKVGVTLKGIEGGEGSETDDDNESEGSTTSWIKPSRDKAGDEKSPGVDDNKEKRFRGVRENESDTDNEHGLLDTDDEDDDSYELDFRVEADTDENGVAQQTVSSVVDNLTFWLTDFLVQSQLHVHDDDDFVHMEAQPSQYQVRQLTSLPMSPSI